MKNDAIIFDIDGTLWDACSASAQGWNAGLKNLGIKKIITVEELKSVMGNPFARCVEIIFPELKPRYPELFRTLNDYEMEAVKAIGGVFYEGVIDGIKNLAKSYKIFIVSNCQDWYMQILLDHSGFGPILAGVDCNGMSGLSKDKMLARIKNDHSLKKPVYIGDTASDQEAARLASMEFIHVSYGFGSPTDKAIAFDSFAALVGYFLKKNF